jgi:hypothetical protein
MREKLREIAGMSFVWALIIFAVVFGAHAYNSHRVKAQLQTNNPKPKCDPNYTGYCVPNVSYDLNCSDIKHRVKVVGYDDDHFDADHDRIGCESYP